jgi:Flp pilus assembly pilin Flp
MKKLKKFAKTLWKDESGQGMAEYVLLLVIVVGLVFMFKDKIKTAVEGQVNGVTDKISNFGN